ncbi:MAG: carboxypeptidase regulatory-like domain-containing protein [Planctomycetota bacterium]|jgi:protocatechuate 3,4-dioxygenase beta subunit
MRGLWILLVIVAVGLVGYLVFQQSEAGRRTDRTAEAVDETTRTPKVVPASPKDETESEPELTLSVHGIVKDMDKRPVEGAQVKARYWDRKYLDLPGEIFSNSEGVFRLPVPECSWVEVRVRHPEYQPENRYLSPRVEEPEEIILQLGAPARLVVLTPEKKPVLDQKVVASMFYTSVEGWSWYTPLEEVVTDVEGRADLGALAQGHVQIEIDNPAYAKFTQKFEIPSLAPVELEIVLDAGGAVEGMVMDLRGKPVKGARVRPRHGEGRVATTDEKGRYRLEALAEDGVTIMAEAEGFGPGYFGAALGWGRPVPVSPRSGQTIFDIDIVLGTAAWVRGRVVDEKGAALEGVKLDVNVRPSFSGAPDPETDAEGRFVAGPFALEAEKANVTVGLGTEDFRLPKYKKGDITKGGTLDLGDIAVLRHATVRGTVYDLDGSPARKGMVIGGGNRYTSVNPDGTFELKGLPAGENWISARNDVGERLRSPRMTLDIQGGESIEKVELRLARTYAISGHLRTSDGKPHPAVGIAAVETDLEPPFELDGLLRGWASHGEGGSFQIEGLLAGDYLVGLTEWKESKMVLRDTPPPQRVEAGGPEIEFVIPLKGGVFKGAVVSKRTGLPVPNFRVVFLKHVFFIPQYGDSASFESAEGTFEHRIEEPGTYAVEIRARGHASVRTKTFSVERGGVIDIGTVRLGDAGRIHGTVRDHSGQPVGWTRIHILNAKMQTNYGAPFTQPDGSFEIEGVSPGIYNIFAVSPRHPLAILRGIGVKEGESVRVSVGFAPSAPLEILVTDESGAPLPSAKLVWTFADLKPLNSSMASGYEPPGYGVNVSDAQGIIRKPYLPATEVELRIQKDGFRTVDRKVQLERGEAKRIEIRLERSG